MRVILVGAGAVGGLLGAMLARSGVDVAFVARGATRDVLRSSGVRVRTPDECFETGPFEAEENPEMLAPPDTVFVTVKSWQVKGIAPRLRSWSAPAVVPLQNGVLAAEVLAESLGDAPVLGGLCHVLASADAPGEVTVRGAPLRIALGERSGGSSPRVDMLAAALRAAGVTVAIPADIRIDLWEKLLFVGPMGLVGASTGLAAGEYRALAKSRGLLEGAMAEVARVAGAHGVRVSDDAIVNALARLDALPPDARTSMQRDLEAGRQSELEEQVGVIVRMAESAGIDAPIHRVLYAARAAQAAQAAAALP